MPVVFHDPDVERMTDGTGHVNDLTAEHVTSLTLPDGDHVPTLAAVLSELPDLRLNIDIKDAAGIEPVTRLIQALGAKDRTCVTSFSERRAAAARRLLGPDACTGLGIGGIVRFALTGRTGGARVLQLPFRWHGVRVVTRGVVSRAHAAGLPVHVWTLDDVASIEHAIEVGVDGIMTDRPEVLKQVLVDRGLWGPSASRPDPG